jgi:hypothetical protein
VVSELKDLDWGFEFIIRQHQDVPRMVVQTRSITEKSSDLPTPPTSSMEQQFATFTAELSQRLSEQEARNDYKFESLKKPVTPAPHSPPYRQASPVQPRSHPHHSAHAYSDLDPHAKRHQEHEFHPQRPYRHFEETRREPEWRSTDNLPKWHTPRAELTKFNGSNVVDWIEDCEFYFDVTHTPEHSKVTIITPCLMGEAREWYRYFKLNNYEPYWAEFKEEILDRFSLDNKNPID